MCGGMWDTEKTIRKNEHIYTTKKCPLACFKSKMYINKPMTESIDHHLCEYPCFRQRPNASMLLETMRTIMYVSYKTKNYICLNHLAF